MKSLYPMADIMTLMTKIEGNINKLGVIYTSEEERNAIDEGLIDSVCCTSRTVNRCC